MQNNFESTLRDVEKFPFVLANSFEKFSFPSLLMGETDNACHLVARGISMKTFTILYRKLKQNRIGTRCTWEV